MSDDRMPTCAHCGNGLYFEHATDCPTLAKPSEAPAAGGQAEPDPAVDLFEHVTALYVIACQQPQGGPLRKRLSELVREFDRAGERLFAGVWNAHREPTPVSPAPPAEATVTEEQIAAARFRMEKAREGGYVDTETADDKAIALEALRHAVLGVECDLRRAVVPGTLEQMVAQCIADRKAEKTRADKAEQEVKRLRELQQRRAQERASHDG